MRILISGAGVAGPTLAWWLRHFGHAPTLVEEAPQLRTGGYVIDFWGTGYQVAERMGLDAALRTAGYRINELRLVDDRGDRIARVPAGIFVNAVQGKYVSLPRGDLAAAIYASLGTVETLFGDSIRAIREHQGGVRVEFERGPAREFDLVVGADGLHSRVRELVFGPESRFEANLGYKVAAFEAAGYRPRDELVYVSRTRPGRQMARFALRGDRTMFFLVFRDDDAAAHIPAGDAERRAILRGRFGDFGWESERILDAMEGSEPIYFDRVSQIRMPHWSKGRVALVGDAAACVSLLAGEGTGLAMTGAYVLAGELHRAGGDFAAAFAAYAARMRPFIREKQDAAKGFARWFAPKTALDLLLRNTAMRAMAVPAIGRFFLARAFNDDFALPEY